MTTELWLLWMVLMMGLAALGGMGGYWLYSRRGNDDVESFVAYALPDYTDRAGFRVDTYPDDEILIPERFWLVNNDTAAIEYNVVPDNAVTLRVAKTGLLRIPEEFLDHDYESEDEFLIDDIRVTKQQSAGRYAMLSWQRGEFDYVLLAENPEMNLIGGVSTNFVRGTSASRSR